MLPARWPWLRCPWKPFFEGCCKQVGGHKPRILRICLGRPYYLINIKQVLESDIMLQGHDTCKYVFTDITFGVPGDFYHCVGQEMFSVKLVIRSRAIGVGEGAGGFIEKCNMGRERPRLAHIFPQTWQVCRNFTVLSQAGG